VLAVGELEAEDVVDPAADRLLVRQPGELLRAAPAGDDPALLVAGEEGGVGRRVVVVEELEEEAEAAVRAALGEVAEALSALGLAYVVAALGLPDDLLRTVAVVVLIGFGLCLAVPPLAARLEAALQRVVPARAVRREGEGFASGVVVGASAGLLYVPCAGPIL